MMQGPGDQVIACHLAIVCHLTANFLLLISRILGDTSGGITAGNAAVRMNGAETDGLMV